MGKVQVCVVIFILMSLLGGELDSGQSFSVEQLRSELARVSVATVTCGAHTATFQPSHYSGYHIEDCYLVEIWEFANGIWKFIGIFNGVKVICSELIKI